MPKNAIAAKIEESVLKSTVKIHTSSKIYGTGFVIFKMDGNNQKKFFLVTNKHLVGTYSLIDGQIHEYFDCVSFSVNYQDGSHRKIDVSLKDRDGSAVIVYPEPYVDVAVVKIPDDAALRDEQEIAALSCEYLATEDALKKWYVDMGDLVFTLGFLYTIYSPNNDYPVAKSGYIASCPGPEKIIKFDYLDKNKNIISREIKAKVILLDGTLQGGPIIIPRGKRERTDTQTGAARMGAKTMPNLIIGIQSPSFMESGISVAFGSEYILELIEKSSS